MSVYAFVHASIPKNINNWWHDLDQQQNLVILNVYHYSLFAFTWQSLFANNSHYEANTAKNLLYHREARQMPETIKKGTSVGASA